jgi:hypothetical protein
VKELFVSQATREVRVKRGAPVFPAPRALKHDKKLWRDENWRPLYGKAGNGWRLIGYWDDMQPQYGYVHKSDIIETRAVEVVEPEASPPDVEALQIANAALKRQNDIMDGALRDIEEQAANAVAQP